MARPGAFILGCAGTRLTDAERAFFRESAPWGFILFDRNLEDPEQVRRLVGALRESVGRDAPVLIDQEGGRVQRLRRPHWRNWRPALDQVTDVPEADARGMYLRMQLIGTELRALGIDVNCAPLADVAGQQTHPVLQNRCYGRDPESVIRVARAVADGLLSVGVLPVLKHIPGHGSTGADSHLELPVVEAPADRLRGWDFAPFTALADLPLGMSAHVVYPAFDDRPATLSPTVLQLVRDEIGFDGLLMSDDISMGALGGAIGARSRAAIAAGCDLVLHCNGDMGEMEQVAREAGLLGPASEARAERALALRGAAPGIDIPAVEAELEALLQGRVYA